MRNRPVVLILVFACSLWVSTQVLLAYPICTAFKQSERQLTDWSGDVTVAITLWKSDRSQRACAIGTVPTGFVLVGGGAWTDYSGPGALLTASYPNYSLTSWRADSKDHSSPDQHYIWIQTVGLKLEGLTANELRSHMRYNEYTSIFLSNRPWQNVGPGRHGYTLIGGGARINWDHSGSLLTQSYPMGNSWVGAGKDHSSPNYSTMTAFAIGIKNYIPGFGYLDIEQVSGPEYTVGTGTQTRWVFNSSGWVPTCPGAFQTYDGSGRLLTRMEIVGDDVSVTSKDHSHYDTGTLQAHMIRIRKRP